MSDSAAVEMGVQFRVSVKASEQHRLIWGTPGLRNFRPAFPEKPDKKSASLFLLSVRCDSRQEATEYFQRLPQVESVDSVLQRTVVRN